MNPFNFTGPEFLFFYIVLTVITMVVIQRVRWRSELDETPFSDTPWNDPYRIAFLRGGKNELVRVAIVSLVDRGLLEVLSDKLQTTNVGRETKARKRVEQNLLETCGTARDPKDLFSSSEFKPAEAEYENELARMRLMPNEEMKKKRRSLFMWAAALMLAVSLTKIGVALMRGRTNIGFLITLTIIVLLVLLPMVAFPRLTARGRILLENVQNLFASLKVRAPQIRPGGASTELVMLAAVFGISAVPRENFPWTHQLFARADTSSATSSSSSSCGSSCGSSSCGGGGCGGGCGGCGS